MTRTLALLTRLMGLFLLAGMAGAQEATPQFRLELDDAPLERLAGKVASATGEVFVLPSSATDRPTWDAARVSHRGTHDRAGLLDTCRRLIEAAGFTQLELSTKRGRVFVIHQPARAGAFATLAEQAFTMPEGLAEEPADTSPLFFRRIEISKALELGAGATGVRFPHCAEETTEGSMLLPGDVTQQELVLGLQAMLTQCDQLGCALKPVLASSSEPGATQAGADLKSALMRMLEETNFRPFYDPRSRQLVGVQLRSKVARPTFLQLGLRNRDVVSSWNGHSVTSSDGLARIIEDHPAGVPVELEILRHMKEHTLQLELAQPLAVGSPHVRPWPTRSTSRLQELESLLEEASLPTYYSAETREAVGIQIRSKVPAPQFVGLALRNRDVLLSVNDSPILAAGALRDVVRELEADAPIVFRIVRNGNELTIRVPAESKPEAGVEDGAEPVEDEPKEDEPAEREETPANPAGSLAAAVILQADEPTADAPGASAGETLEVAVVIDSGKRHLAAYGLELEWDRSELTVLRVDGGKSEFDPPFVVNLEADKGVLRFNGISVVPQAKGKVEVARLTVKLLQKPDSGVWTIERHRNNQTVALFDDDGITPLTATKVEWRKLELRSK